MSELFNIYQDNLNIIFAKINKILSNLSQLPSGKIKYLIIEKFDASCKDIEINLKEGERMLKQMDLEITTNSFNGDNKSNFHKTYSTYKKKYDDIKAKFFKIKEDYTYTKKMEKMILSNPAEADHDYNLDTDSNSNQKQKLLDKVIISSNSSEKLQQAKRSAYEMEKMSKVVIHDLENQTDKLKGTGVKVAELNNNIDRSTGILARISNREQRNKTIIGIFSVTLVTFLCVFILYNYSSS